MKSLRAVLVALIASACTSAAPNPAFEIAAHNEQARQPDFYTNGEARAYLVIKDHHETGLLWGSYHTAYTNETVMPRPIRDRFDSASDLTVEFVMDRLSRPRLETLRRQLTARVATPDPAALARLQPATRSALDDVDLPGTARDKLSLHGWALAILTKAIREPPGNTPQVGFVDLNLIGFARSRQIPVFGLETPDRQLEAFRIDPNGEIAAAEVERALRMQPDYREFRAWSLAMYGQGRIDVLMAGVTAWKAQKPDLEQSDRDRLAHLTSRNADWLPLLQTRFDQPGFHFIAFGAGHLVGRDGVVALLRQAGFTVLPCPGDNCPSSAT